MPAISASKWMVNAGWNDVPHLDEETKTQLLAETQPYLRDARSKGTPSLGAGAVYPVEQDIYRVPPFHLPAYWPRAYGLDVGWNKTACIWGALDRDSGIIYLYSEHYRGQAEPSIHASAIKARGEWIPGVIDPAANGRSQKDGERLIAQYRALGLNITNAENSVEAGIQAVWELLSTGRLKVFSSLANWFTEVMIYRRDENGKIVKKFDHAMDATRYLIVSGIARAIVRPVTRITGTAAGSTIADEHGGY
jgi:hypothetical protein